ncbi:MAG: ABC transporter permease [Sulfolobales archaeon]
MRGSAYRFLESLLQPLISLAIAIVISIFFLQITGYPSLRVINVMFSTGYSDIQYLLTKASPYILTGLAFSIPFTARVFNIGGEGQLYLGALLALASSYYTGNPIFVALAGVLGGCILALSVALLRIYRNVNEVVSAIMLNWIMYYLVSFFIGSYLYDPNAPYQSRPVPSTATIDSNIMFLTAFMVAVMSYIILRHTALGFMIRVSGTSVKSAIYAGIDPRKSILYSMILGGSLAGLAGALIPMGVRPHVIDSTMAALYGIGFLGIGVGLLGRNNPFGIILSSIFVAGLVIGGQNAERITGIAPEIVDVIIGIIVISLSAPMIFKIIKRGAVE